MNAVRSMTPDFFAMVFGLCALTMGAHWELSEEESSSLSKAGWTMMDTFPKADKKKWERWIQQYVPRLMFTLMLGWIVGERVAETVKQAKLARAKNVKPFIVGGSNNAATKTENVQGRTNEPEPEPQPTGTKQFLSDPISEAFGGVA